MTQEQKELLLKDLCARLPYDVTIHHHWEIKGTDRIIDVDRKLEFSDVESLKYILTELQDNQFIIEWKPYLRPMSSMTEEEFEKLKEYSELKYEQLDLASYQDGTHKCLDFYLSEVPSYVVILVFDWLNAHHFDYRGLIEMGLAIEVTKDSNPYK